MSAAEDKDGFEDATAVSIRINKDGIEDDDDAHAEDKDDVEMTMDALTLMKKREAKSSGRCCATNNEPSADVEKTDGAQEDGKPG